MLYKPKYCCNCGERIEREEWRPWTSRRFCSLCETDYKGYDLMPKAIVIVGLGLAVLGVTGFFRAQQFSVDQPLSKTTSFRPARKLKPVTSSPSADGSANDQSSATAGLPGSSVDRSEIIEQPKKEKRTSDEIVFYCGAITKRGTPCTRRVKKQGYCWQHAKASQIARAPY